MRILITKKGLKLKFVISTCVIMFFLLIIGNFIIITFQDTMFQSVVNFFHNQMDQMISERKIVEVKKLDKNVKWNADIFTRSIATYVNNYALEDIKHSLKGFMSYPEMRAVIIYETDGSTLSNAWKNKNTIVFDPLPENYNLDHLIIYKTTMISIYDEKLGSISFYYTYDEIDKTIAAIKNKTHEKTRKTIDHINKNFSKAKVYIVIGSIGTVLLLILSIIVCLDRLIIKPLKDITHIAGELSTFDISFNIDTKRQDEIGLLYDAIDKMIIAFRDIMLNIQSKCHFLSQISDNLVFIASTLSENSKELHLDSEKISSAAVDMNANIAMIADTSKTMNTNASLVQLAIENMNNNINTVASATEEMSQSMNQVRTNAQKGKDITITAVQMMKKTENLIESLTNVASKVVKVTHLIKRIAHKTDILAINASISASEINNQSNNSFVAIAAEIKRFSLQSRDSANTIAIQIETMTQSFIEVVDFMNNINGMTNDISDSSEDIFMSVDQQSAASQEIASNAVQANSFTKEIEKKMSNLTTHSEDVSQHASIIAKRSNGITKNIQGIDSKISNNYSISKEIKQSAEEIKAFSAGFKEIVSEFKLET